MNWVTTNIRFPEDLYMEIKIEAAKKRKSVAALVRDKFTRKSKKKQRDVKTIMKELDKLAKETARQNPGINFTEKLIEMRYEQ
ncbi:hypothetical protein HYT02_05955 [Candidatus Gottesmanbacteria bacterium]|nr:hypothetical protein [Candidatus Gottesmanbacteria bacterium]